LLTVVNTLEVKAATNNVVTHTRKVLYTTTTYEHNGVLLEVVAFTTNVSSLSTAAGTSLQVPTWQAVDVPGSDIDITLLF
jgi:hypothetical protein